MLISWLTSTSLLRHETQGRLVVSEPFTPTKRPITSLTVQEVAQRYRVSPDKVRGWIGRGELRAINTASALCARPRWVIPPEALVEFELARRGGIAVRKPKSKRRRQAHLIDFYPD